MPILLDLLLLLILFIALGWAANFTVNNIKYIGATLKIRLFAFGILLGLISNLPELFLGINATVNDVATVSVGNLIGGIIFRLGLILGAGLLIHKKIITDGCLKFLIPTILVIFSPIMLGVDGKYGFFDGLLMVSLYIGLIFYLYHLNHFGHHHIIKKDDNHIAKSFLIAFIGIIITLITSHWIVKITLDLLNYVKVSQLLIGLIVFSIGTNLPEISIAFTSWRKKSPELSLSVLLSSTFTNVLVLGTLTIIQPIIFDTSLVFWTSALFSSIILILFTYFYYSGKKMDRREGAILLAGYILFIMVNICFGLFGE